MSMQPHFLKDLEVREMASLDHAQLARSITQGIALSSPPFRIALFGPWGSGKTTILKLVQATVEETAASQSNPYYRCFWFNAWEYESGANLFHSLISLLVKELPDGVRYSRKGSAVVSRLLEAARIHGRRFADDRESQTTMPSVPPGGGADDAVAYGLESIQADTERFVDMLLVHGGKRRKRCVVVSIDDLDKCLPLQALSLLESIKLFFGGQAAIVFLCSIDSDVLRNMVRSKYGATGVAFATSYIEKIFEFNFEVPTISTVQVKGLVEEVYIRSGLADRGISQEQAAMETEVLENVLTRPGLTFNPRRIKRIFNRFIWFFTHEPLSDPKITESGEALDPWLTWLLASDYWRPLRDYVNRFDEVAFRELGNRITGHPFFPHSNDAAKQTLNSFPEARHMLDFLRASVRVPEDPHLAESQEEVRVAIMNLHQIDSQLRSFGL